MKEITVQISNKELDALEDLLCHQLVWNETHPDEFKDKRKVCIDLWSKLCKEFDKNDEEIHNRNTSNRSI